MLTETPEIIVGKCANDSCGNEISQGEEYVTFPSNCNMFCSLDCLNDQQLKEGNIEWHVAGDDTAVVVRKVVAE